MKKFLFSLTVLFSLFIKAHADVTFNRSWVEYDVDVNNMSGMYFHFDFVIHSQAGSDLDAYVYVYDSYTNKLKSYHSDYTDWDGSVFGPSDKFTPKYDNSAFNDFKVFIPYEAMPIASKGLSYKYNLEIGWVDGPCMRVSEMYTFDWAKHSPSAKIEKIWVDHNYLKNNEKGMMIHAKVLVDNNKNIRTNFACFFYDQYGNQLTTNSKTYTTNDGHLSVYENCRPNYTNSIWNDFQLFIPYSLFPSASGTKEYKFHFEVRDIARNFHALAISEKQTFTITNNGAVDCDKPIIDWLSGYSSNSPNFVAKVGIKSNTNLTQTSIAVQGDNYRGMKTVSNDGYQKTLNETLTLREGVNEIQVSATNSCGTTTQTYRVTYNKTSPAPVPTTVENRIALVVGNANYPNSPLSNPVNDAYDIAASLKSLGFEVITLVNGTKRQMDDAVSELRSRANANSVTLFYYAGHGIQKDGRNYLIPIDANLRDASDIEYACTDVNRVLSNMEASGCTKNILVLDACRDNPFEKSWSRSLGTRGLSSINAPDGTLISYSTSPGEVALDGRGRNSPYAAAFLKTLNTPGLGIYDFFQEVISDVRTSTGKAQTPWMTTSFVGKFYFNPAQ